MRNLSKVLALVLSLAFVLTMFAGAIATVPETTNYSDAAELSAAGSEAVNVLSALGIVNGYTDGSFQPASLVTRAEFAKMMSVALANTDVTTFYSVSTLPFNDTFDAWCIPYINYCYLNELMVGYGDGYMLPKNNVTGFEAIKMVLVGLGYDPKVEGLEGSAWQTNTAKLANRIGLLKNLETENIYAAFDREATAILVRNAIYTETVEYVGSSAVSTGKTLGEKVYDLMDIRGIVVGNEYGYLGANWTNAAITDQTTTIKPVYYIDYQNQVVKGQTIFAYRDFTGAATTGGYYVPRIVHVALASDYADLGRAYRILTTGAQNPTNTNEVRKIYGVIEEIATGDALDYVYKKGILSDGGLTGGVNDKDAADLTGKIGAMLDSAQIANVNVTKDSVQNNIFIDGKAASYADAVAHIAKYAKSSAPYYYVDNDNDGIVDYVALWTYTVAKVLAVAEDGKLTLSGVGTAKTYITDDTIAVGDYVAYYGDKQFNYVDKLEVYVGNVTGYSKNSNHGSTPVDGLSVTEAGGVYTINGKSYTFGSLVGTLNDATQAYFENLMGTGSAALYGTTLQFVFDGSYIVAAFVTEDSYWANYAIFVYSNP
ncbi:MAG: S-layer homology domain-containing protein, partial [Clostridiales bacterium]|nr:S-layer homology domain-containing protein [Clostridiales bacterium]